MLVEGEEEQQSWAQLVTPGEDAAAGAAVVGDKWRDTSVCNAPQWYITQFNAIQCNAMLCNAMQSNAMQFNAMQCNVVQCNVMQCNAIQCNSLYCKERRGQGHGPGPVSTNGLKSTQQHNVNVKHRSQLKNVYNKYNFFLQYFKFFFFSPWIIKSEIWLVVQTIFLSHLVNMMG